MPNNGIFGLTCPESTYMRHIYRANMVCCKLHRSKYANGKWTALIQCFSNLIHHSRHSNHSRTHIHTALFQILCTDDASEAFLGSVSCPRKLQHVDRRNQRLNHRPSAPVGYRLLDGKGGLPRNVVNTCAYSLPKSKATTRHMGHILQQLSSFIFSPVMCR